jgi:DnaJ-class molecular chaperone
MDNNFMTEDDRRIMEGLELRQRENKHPCPKCEGCGIFDKKVCSGCLGQGIVLSDAEWNLILDISGALPDEDDSILNASTIE